MALVTQLNEPELMVKNALGESPLWHPIENRLYWLDIEKGVLFRFDPLTQKLESFDLGIKTGSFGFRKEGGLILATEFGFAFWSEKTGRSSNFLDLYSPEQGIMMNDGRVDSSGRFWAGSKSSVRNADLFIVFPDLKCENKLSQVHISNGIDWSADDRVCYHTDSGSRTITQFKYESSSGKLSDPFPFYTLSAISGSCTPDGLCLDSQGNIWAAIWDGSKILQLSPEGKILQEVLMPVSRPTSLTFGGRNLEDIYITSASTGLSNEDLSRQPFAGDVFVLHSNISGRPPNFFLG